MIFDFYQITGPEKSKNENFESLCRQILMTEYPNLTSVSSLGGDEGLDAFCGIINNELSAFQFKYFLENLGTSQKRQIEHSLKSALEKHKLISWTLMIPIDLNPNGIRWFESLRLKYSHVKLSYKGKSEIQKYLIKNPLIARAYQPRPLIFVFDTDAKKVRTDEELIINLNDLLKNLSNVSDNVELDLAVSNTAKFYKNRAKLKILIWGPGENYKELYKKRLEIKERLISAGFEAHFSEDIWTPEILERTGLNITVAEFLQAKAYDYVVCLMASPGSIAEAHDFAKNKNIAHKMMICVDINHRSGYSASGMLKIFEGNNGKIDWFLNPKDLNECHLATRIYHQIENVSHARQWEFVKGVFEA